MKHLLLSVLLTVALFGIVMAQPVLRASNVAPRDGDRIRYYRTEFQPVGAGGPAQSWDFSRLGISSNLHPASWEVNYSNADISTGGNIVGRSDGRRHAILVDSVSMLWTNVNNLTVYGNREHIYKETYLDPQQIMRFPFGYGDSFVDSFHFFQQEDNSVSEWFGTDSVLADGWGSISLPGRTVSGVLRVKTIFTAMRIAQNTTEGTADTSYRKWHSYNWYLPGRHERLLLMEEPAPGYVCEGCSAADGLYSTITTGIDMSLTGNEVPLSLLQNPVKDMLRLHAATDVDLHYRIVDAKGSIVRRGDWAAASAPDLSLSVSDLAPGIYCIVASGQDLQSVTRRFQVE
jgi:hypothetical protein